MLSFGSLRAFATSLSTRTAQSRFSTSSLVHAIRSDSKNLQYGPVGVARALAASKSTAIIPTPTLFAHEFALTDRVALVTGGNRGIGLEAAMALSEADARAVYCVDLPEKPGDEWRAVHDYLGKMGGKGRLEYVTGDVRNQAHMWHVAEEIGKREGRFDISVAAAGIWGGDTPSLEYQEGDFQDVIHTNLNGAMYTAQATGRQMVKFKTGGNIIFIASICGHVALEPHLRGAAYHSSKSGVLQLARSMACELASQGIRVNTISPGFFKTPFTALLEVEPELMKIATRGNPLGRLGRPEELRGVITWLASDASSFCTGSDIIVSGGHTAW